MNKFENNGPENPGRRGFFKKIIGGAVVAGIASVGVNKYMEEDKNNELFLSFKGQEENFSKAHEAATMLIDEMNKSNIEEVKLIGNHPDNKIEILRTFLTNHLNSRVGHKYTCRDKIISSGFYTEEDLINIINESTSLAHKK